MSIHVSLHACERFVERVTACTLDQAREHILSHAKAIEAAADFGCEVVRCAGGERLVRSGTRVLTVYGAGHLPFQLRSPFYPGEDGQPL
jgi:hypothetical protein